MRRIYAVLVQPTATERWFGMARALARYSVGRRHGGWPESFRPERGTWRPTPTIDVSWRTVSDTSGRAFRLVVDEPFTDEVLRQQTVATIVDRPPVAYVAVETFVRSTSTTLAGTVSYDNRAPGLTALLVEKLDVLDGPYRLRGVPLDLAGRPRQLGGLLVDERRKHPVVVVVDPDMIGGVGPEALAQQMAGLAHVVTCDRLTASELWEVSGLGVSYGHQAGLFWTGYPGGSSRPGLWSSQHCVPSEYGTPCWPAVRTVFSTAALRLAIPDDFKRIEAAELRARLAAAEKSERSTEEFDELLAGWETDLERLDELERVNELLAQEIEQLRVDLDATLGLFDLALERQRAAASRNGVTATGTTAATERGFKTNLEAVEAAAQDATNLEFLPSAFVSAEKQCAFARPDDLYDDLMTADQLAARWVADDLEPGGLTATAVMLGLVWRSGISATAAGQYAADYIVSYEQGEVMLGPHFGRGANSSNHYRCYLHLDRNRKKVVVGYIGRHLRDATNR